LEIERQARSHASCRRYTPSNSCSSPTSASAKRRDHSDIENGDTPNHVTHRISPHVRVHQSQQHGRTSHTPCLMTWHRKNSMGKKLKSIMKEAARHIRHVHTSGQSRYQRRVGHTVRHSAARHTRNDGYWREKRHTKERTRNRKSTDAPYSAAQPIPAVS